MKRLLRHSAALALGSGMLVCHLRAFQVASGSVEGVVVDVATGMPMDEINVNGPVQLPPTNLPPGVGRVLPRNIFANRPKATTDDEGRFVLRGLPLGPVEVTFEKDQYFLDSRFYTLPPAQQLNV